jgi:hypothetical protein
LGSFGAPQWIAGIYLGVGGGALAFILWVLALERATPTRAANTMTVNPIAAACSLSAKGGRIPTRLTCPTCCARATSGHAAAPPTRPMNARRSMRLLSFDHFVGARE